MSSLQLSEIPEKAFLLLKIKFPLNGTLDYIGICYPYSSK
jgi:hypothetical protein